MVTVKELIIKLLEYNMADEIVVRDIKTKKRIRNCEIIVKEQKKLGCLFG